MRDRNVLPRNRERTKRGSENTTYESKGKEGNETEGFSVLVLYPLICVMFHIMISD